LEQPVRRLALIGAGVALLLFAVLLYRSAPRALPDHAYPIPGTDNQFEVEVLNGSGRAGAARAATRVLRRSGLDVVFFGNADESAREVTRLLVRRGDSTAARRAARVLGVGATEWAPDSTRRVDLTVILGMDYQPPSELHP
jgi:hypothetical protein